MRIFLLLSALFPLRTQNHTSWYSDYCADSVESNVIAGLSASELASVGSLEQVQVLFRHGARVTAGHQCFNNKFQPVWNCSLATLFASHIKDGGDKKAALSESLVFRKIFQTDNAWQDNVYPGNCMAGELIKKGAEQEMRNGRNLRSRYVGDDKRIHLWGKDDGLPKLSSSEIWLYSTNYQRTQASLYYMLLGLYRQEMIPGEVPLHTRDAETDHFAVHKSNCPQFQAKLSSAWTSVLNKFSLNPVFKVFDKEWLATFDKHFEQTDSDCILSNFCAGNNLPPQLSDTSSKIFIDATSYGLQMHNEFYQNEETSVPLASMMLQDFKHKFDLLKASGLPKLALWSAHDSTISCFLSSMEMMDKHGGPFPVYATLITIETYLLKHGGHGVRVTRNGRPITSLIPECHGANICKAEVFFNKLDVVDWDPICSTADSRSYGHVNGIVIVVGVVCGTFVVGLLISYLKKKLNFRTWIYTPLQEYKEDIKII